MAIQLSKLHKFLECNLPEYERKDLLVICKLFLKVREIKTGAPYKEVFNRLQDFKDFIITDWQGEQKESFKRIQAHGVVEDYGRCTCGKRFVKRVNKLKGNEFLGCSGYPKCKNTKQLS